MNMQQQIDESLQYTWALYRRYAKTSRKLKTSINRWRLSVLGLTLAGAIFGTASLQISTSTYAQFATWLGWFSALSIALSAFFTTKFLKAERERRWIQARSTAEALKSEAYLYATRTPPYDKENAPKNLLNRTNEIRHANEILQLEDISESEQLKACPPSTLSVDEYVSQRVNEQIENFYKPSASKNKQALSRGNTIVLLLEFVAIFLGSLKGLDLSVSLSGWIAVISTATTAIIAFLYAGRYSYLEISYQSTSNQLDYLLTRWKISDKDQSDNHLLIKSCESAISVENSAWMAEWSKKKKQGSEGI